MTTLATLIGGLVLILILYTTLGWVSALTQATRAILASSLTLITYFLLIVGRWPGLDVVAMHISIFLVSGLLLYLYASRRRNKARLHWVPKTLIGFFVLLAVINSFLLYISTRGLPPQIARYWLPGDDIKNSGFSGVVGHDQTAAKAVSSELSRSHASTQLGWRIQTAGLQRPALTSQIVSVKVVDRSGLPVQGLQVQLNLLRPGAVNKTATIPLVYKEAGEYSNVLDIPAKGRWLMEMELSQQGQVMYREARELNLP
ncbi:MAG: FixH family protein [Thiobacillus sp.]